ncbi:MAG: hypothetical protein FWG90_05705 [Oscillospiraceae bacterium]|nr:hypothetical protein [Oscillospiraceae bacterium]
MQDNPMPSNHHIPEESAESTAVSVTENTSKEKPGAPKPSKAIKYRSLSDIITVQAIICVIIGIGFAALNIFKPQIAVELYEIYSRHANEDSKGSIIEFINSTPVEQYD